MHKLKIFFSFSSSLCLNKSDKDPRGRRRWKRIPFLRGSTKAHIRSRNAHGFTNNYEHRAVVKGLICCQVRWEIGFYTWRNDCRHSCSFKTRVRFEWLNTATYQRPVDKRRAEKSINLAQLFNISLIYNWNLPCACSS